MNDVCYHILIGSSCVKFVFMKHYVVWCLFFSLKFTEIYFQTSPSSSLFKASKMFNQNDRLSHVSKTRRVYFSHDNTFDYTTNQSAFNSFITAKPNFVLFGTIFSVAVTFFQRPNSKFWHAEKIDLEKSFQMSTNLTCFVFVNAGTYLASRLDRF